MFSLNESDYLGKSDEEIEFSTAFQKIRLLEFSHSDNVCWAKGVQYRLDETIESLQDHTKVFDVIKVPLFNEDGSRKGLVVLGRDVSMQKTLETKLLRAKKLEAVGLMASRLAHEFKNILQSITGYSNFAQEGLSPNDRRFKDIDEVLKAAERADMVVKSLLNADKKFNLKLIRNSIHSIVEQFVKSGAKSFGKEYKLNYFPSDEILQYDVNCDSVHLELVVLNICLNAVDAMPNGGSINIKTYFSEFNDHNLRYYDWVKSNRFISIEISDFGFGMDENVLESVFEPFFTTKSVDKGIGLGLSSAFDIVKSHAGFMEVNSKLGEGTEFFIHIPIVE